VSLASISVGIERIYLGFKIERNRLDLFSSFPSSSRKPNGVFAFRSALRAIFKLLEFLAPASQAVPKLPLMRESPFHLRALSFNRESSSISVCSLSICTESIGTVLTCQAIEPVKILFKFKLSISF